MFTLLAHHKEKPLLKHLPEENSNHNHVPLHLEGIMMVIIYQWQHGSLLTCTDWSVQSKNTFALLLCGNRKPISVTSGVDAGMF